MAEHAGFEAMIIDLLHGQTFPLSADSKGTKVSYQSTTIIDSSRFSWVTTDQSHQPAHQPKGGRYHTILRPEPSKTPRRVAGRGPGLPRPDGPELEPALASRSQQPIKEPECAREPPPLVHRGEFQPVSASSQPHHKTSSPQNTPAARINNAGATRLSVELRDRLLPKVSGPVFYVNHLCRDSVDYSCRFTS